MCRQMRGKIRLLFSYLSILVIGILIYLFVLFIADKHRKEKELRADSPLNTPTIAPAISNESSKSLVANNGESSGESSVANNAESPSVADKESLNELPNEINVAINTIDSQIVPNSAVDSGAFPRDFVVATKVLRIRTAPSTDSEVIKLFKEGAVIRISRVEGKWAQLENGGWAYMSLLKER